MTYIPKINKIITPIILAIILFASPAYAFTSPPGLLDKLDEMFVWTREQMDRPNMPRPPIFISSPAIFQNICEHYETASDEFSCDETAAFYLINEWEIHVEDNGATIIMDGTLIHEMVHAVQHVIYGTAFMSMKKHKKLLQEEARLLANQYIIEKHRMHTGR